VIIEITTEIIWGTFLDVKHWHGIKNPKKYEGQRVVIGSVTDGYHPQEKEFGNTRKLLEHLRGCGREDKAYMSFEYYSEDPYVSGKMAA